MITVNLKKTYGMATVYFKVSAPSERRALARVKGASLVDPLLEVPNTLNTLDTSCRPQRLRSQRTPKSTRVLDIL